MVTKALKRWVRGKTVFDYILILIFILLSAVTIIPFLNIVAISLSGYKEVVKSTSMLWPRDFSIAAYFIVGKPDIYKSFLLTVFIVVTSTVLHLVLCLFSAYAISNKNVPGRQIMLVILIIPMLFGGGFVPYYLVIKALKMIDTIWVFIIPGMVSSFSIILMKNFLIQIPASLEESARMDGAGVFAILFKIIAPLSKPILATLALFYGVGKWNDWFTGVMFINNPKLLPIQNLLHEMNNIGGDPTGPSIFRPDAFLMDVSVKMAVTIIATIPIVAVYPFLQRYFVKGIFMGSVKA